MKVLYLLVAAIFISSSAFAQLLNFDREKQTNYEDKIETYRIMERAGTNLAISGGLASVAGLYLLSDSNWIDDSSSASSDDAAGTLGVILLSKGVPVAIMGLVFRTVGINSQRKYQEKLNRLVVFIKLCHLIVFDFQNIRLKN